MFEKHQGANWKARKPKNLFNSYKASFVSYSQRY